MTPIPFAPGYWVDGDEVISTISGGCHRWTRDAEPHVLRPWYVGLYGWQKVALRINRRTHHAYVRHLREIAAGTRPVPERWTA